MREQVQKFNKLVIEARDEKPRVVQECHRLEREIRKVHVLLPEEHRRKIPPIFDMEPDETQEGLFDISPSEVEAEEQSLLAAAGLQNIMDDIVCNYMLINSQYKKSSNVRIYCCNFIRWKIFMGSRNQKRTFTKTTIELALLSHPRRAQGQLDKPKPLTSNLKALQVIVVEKCNSMVKVKLKEKGLKSSFIHDCIAKNYYSKNFSVLSTISTNGLNIFMTYE